MFDHLGKNFGKGEPYPPQDLKERMPHPFSTDYMNVMERTSYEGCEEECAEQEDPETTIAANVTIKGEMRFEKLMRIDGTFEGELHSAGKLIVGPTGSVKANIALEEAFISGKVEGDICVKKRLVLRGRAEVRGDITAPLLSVDEGVVIIGTLSVSQV